MYSSNEKLNKEVYGERILSRFILTSGKRYFELSKDLNKEENFIDYLCFLQYLLYISSKILEKKYSPDETMIIISSTIDGIVDLLDIKDELKSTTKALLKSDYYECFKSLDLDISKEDDMHKLAYLFEEDLKIEKSATSHLFIFTEFTTFIIHHTEDILFATDSENLKKIEQKLIAKKQRFRKNTALFCILITIIVILVIVLICTRDSSGSKQTISQLESKIEKLEQEKEELDGIVVGLRENNSSLQRTINSMKNEIAFYDACVVFVEDDGTRKYHKYDCVHFVGNYFWAYNVEQAESLGYYACPECH